MQTILSELRPVLRCLWRQKSFSMLVVTTLAITLGSAAAVMMLVDSVLLRPLPYPDAERLVFLFRGSTRQAGPGGDMAPGNCAAIAETRMFESMACWMRSERTVQWGGSAEQIRGARVASNLLDVLGVRLAMGRSFLPEEMGEGRDRVAILTHELWQRRLGGDRNVLGRPIWLDGANHQIIGILPPAFRLYQDAAEIFTPLSLDAESWANHRMSYLQGVARISRNTTLASAQQQLTELAGRLERAHPVGNRELRLDAVPLQSELTRSVKGPLLLLLATAGLLLAMGLANLANLFVTRTEERAGEMAVRRGLGAGTARLAVQVGLEPLVLCLFGGAGGLLLASWSQSLLRLLIPPAMLPYTELRVNNGAIAMLVGLAIVALFSLAVPSALRAHQVADLRGGVQRLLRGGRASWLRHGLLSLEVGFAMLLVFTACLTVESFRQIERVSLGMNPEGLLIAKIPPPAANRLAFYDRVLAEVEAKPGVKSAAFASTIPLKWRGGNFRFELGEASCTPGTCLSLYREVSPRYFETLGIPLLRGRLPGREDHERGERVVTVNQTFVRRFLGGGEGVGKRIRFEAEGEPWRRIVGVVADTKEMGLEADARQTIYVPYRQSTLSFAPPAMIAVKAGKPEARLLEGITTQPVSEVQTMRELLDQWNEVRRLESRVTSFFAFAALVLTGLGLNGMLAYALSRRRREMGLRQALGAGAVDLVVALNRAPALAMVVGLGAGLGAALGLARWMQPILYGVDALDPRVVALALVLPVGMGVAASLPPTWSAIRIPPSEALRDV